MHFNWSYFTLSIRNKILLAVVATFIPFALFMWLISATAINNSLKAHTTNDLINAVETEKALVVASMRFSIKNYLRSVAEHNWKTLNYLYSKQRAGKLTAMEAQKEATEMLLSQNIGQTGYIYCVNSQGIATVHPSRQLVGRDFSSVDIIIKQIEQKEGYQEYEWKNPTDDAARAKVLYMTYFEPWDWIISATAYKDEFKMLVVVDDFRQNLEMTNFGKNGYSFVMDLQGNLIAQPLLQSKNPFDDSFAIEPQVIRTIIKEKKGQQSFYLQNPVEGEPREYMIAYDYIPETAWIVVSSASRDEKHNSLNVIRTRAIATGFFCLFLGMLVATYVGTSITEPIRKLLLRLSRRTPGESFQERNELDQLSAHFNYFLTSLDKTTRRKLQIEQALRSSQEKYRAVMERYRAVMESAPDPIMVLGLKGEVNYLNMAFRRVFGWQLEDFSDNSAAPFNPTPERSYLLSLLSRLLNGEVIADEESALITRKGKRLTVNMSGGPIWDSDGSINGCVIILRDISQLKLLEREVIDTDERDRIRIGQDLHDDLVPHLIGLEVMFNLFRRKINEDPEDTAKQAEKIYDIITDAIKKTRDLSLGLAPVHLVEEGMEMGIRRLGESVASIFGISCEVEWGNVVSFDTTTALHVYRIIQEALNNAVKHANASHLMVKCKTVDNMAIFEIFDNGLGLKNLKDKNGMGLKIMAFRAQRIGGSLSVVEKNGGGTIVRLSVRQEIDPTTKTV